MDLNRLTQKSQRALSEAQDKAVTFGHTEVDGEHLLAALLEDPEGLAPRLLRRMDVSVESVLGALEDALQRRPRVSGPGVEAGKVLVSQRLSELLGHVNTVK